MKPTPNRIFITLSLLALGLIFATWLPTPHTAGFLLLLILILLWALRHRFPHPNMKKTIFVDLAVLGGFYFLAPGVDADPLAFAGLGLVLFQGLFFGFYPMGLVLGYMVISPQPVVIGGAMMGLLLHFWHREETRRLSQRDQFAKKTQDLETLQASLTTALAQVEQMTILAERSRISSDIHDNAGHEIVAAYISLQTVGKIIETHPQKAAELFDKSMARLQSGVEKMRDAVHNMSTITPQGPLHLEAICQDSTLPIAFASAGDMTPVTTNMWHVLEAILKESLTNVAKHAQATMVQVELDCTRYLVRLLVENDGIIASGKPAGSGLRNMQHRVATVGGTLTVDRQAHFRLVCVIPL